MSNTEKRSKNIKSLAIGCVIFFILVIGYQVLKNQNTRIIDEKVVEVKKQELDKALGNWEVVRTEKDLMGGGLPSRSRTYMVKYFVRFTDEAGNVRECGFRDISLFDSQLRWCLEGR